MPILKIPPDEKPVLPSTIFQKFHKYNKPMNISKKLVKTPMSLIGAMIGSEGILAFSDTRRINKKSYGYYSDDFNKIFECTDGVYALFGGDTYW